MTTTFLWEQTFGRMKPATTPLNGRVVCVTGANTGLGLQAAIHLAKLSPAKIILAVRSTEKGNTARETLLAAKGVQAAVDAGLVVEVWQLDLASFASVKAFAKRAEEELQRLDVVVENAGMATQKWTTTEDGWETQTQVNGLATGLLGLLLLPLLRKTAKLPAPDSVPSDNSKAVAFKPHLTIVGSEMHHFAAFKEAALPGPILLNLNKQEEFEKNPMDRYSVTKLIDVYLALGLAALAGDGVVVNVVNPGLCESEFRREMEGTWTAYFLDRFARTAEQGALNLAWAATEDTSSVPGAYVSVTAIKTTSTYTHTEAGREVEHRVWDEMMAVWGDVATDEVHRVLEDCEKD